MNKPFSSTDILLFYQIDEFILAVVNSNIAEDSRASKSRKNRLMVAAGRIGGAYD